MNYEEATEWLFSLRRSGRERELESMQTFLSQIGNPQDSLKAIHIAGTNGKGSTAAMTASILNAAGYRVGMFTSPHLSRFTERIVVNGREIPTEKVVQIVKEWRPMIEELARGKDPVHLTFFEVATAMALWYFAECNVDFAILEAGIGGRLDATNVVRSIVSVITNVGLEHTRLLGDTKIKIAREKAGIIKEKGILITATEDDDVFIFLKETCSQRNSKIFRVGYDLRVRRLSSSLEGQYFQLDGIANSFDRLFIKLLGEHQLLNAASAVGAAEALSFHGIQISQDAVQEGLKRARWPGRLEIAQKHPLIVLDCAKDTLSVQALKKTLQQDFKYRKLIAVVSISSDKNIPEMINQLAQVVDLFILTSHRVMGRAAAPSVIADEVTRNRRPYEIIHDISDAIKRARKLAGRDDMICITGSVFLVGEARQFCSKTASGPE